jgi:O-antigen chain-terminating methyltransferase
MVKALEVKAEKEQLTRLSDQLVSLVENKAEALRGEAKVVASKLQEISQQMLDHKRSILDQQRRLTLLLEEARKRLPEPISGEEIGNMLTEEDHLLDAFYVSFEDRFRGTCEDIKKRVEVYLPLISEANAGTKKTSILDIGCGRGEWLELLKENKLVARGVDTNRIMVSHCKELGLDVEEADAITYLRSLKKNSLGAVTGIHIIEHIPFKRLVALFDETLRVLKPGGVAIFETPNPENLVVGACNFYCDPTHLSPWMPEMIRFVSESRGFSRVEIKRLHPNSDGLQLIGGEENVKTIINKMLFGPQDFAVIAYKGMSMDETAFQQPPKERSL